MLTRFRNIAYVMAYTVATIPLWHYIRDGRILTLMVAVVTFAYINVVLSTVQAAQPILSSEKAKTPLPRWLPDKPKYHKWWLLVCHTLRWHLLLIPPKMGLALGFVHFFYSHYLLQWRTLDFIGFIVLRSFVYYSYQYQFEFAFVGPQWETVFISLVVALGFATLSCCLLVAFVMKAYFNYRTSYTRQVLSLISKQGVIIFALLAILFCVVACYDRIKITNPCYEKTCSYEESLEQEELFMYKLLTVRRVGDTLHTAIFSLIDNSVLLNANIMRPIGENTWFTTIYKWNDDVQDGHWLGPDNRPFVARQIVAGLLGMLLYVGATWAVLWFVEDKS